MRGRERNGERKKRQRNKERMKRRQVKKKQRNEQGKKKTTNSPIFYPSKRCILFLNDSGSNPCPSLHIHRPNPLRYRRLFLLSIELDTFEKYWSMAFRLACFC